MGSCFFNDTSISFSGPTLLAFHKQRKRKANNDGFWRDLLLLLEYNFSNKYYLHLSIFSCFIPTILVSEEFNTSVSINFFVFVIFFGWTLQIIVFGLRRKNLVKIIFGSNFRRGRMEGVKRLSQTQNPFKFNLILAFIEKLRGFVGEINCMT